MYLPAKLQLRHKKIRWAIRCYDGSTSVQIQCSDGFYKFRRITYKESISKITSLFMLSNAFLKSTKTRAISLFEFLISLTILLRANI